MRRKTQDIRPAAKIRRERGEMACQLLKKVKVHKLEKVKKAFPCHFDGRRNLFP